MAQQVGITLLDNGNFNYQPGLLRVQCGDQVQFTCNVPFRAQFLHGTPFVHPTSGQPIAEIASSGTTLTVATTAEKRAYHYAVAAVIGSAPPYLDANCPTIIVF